MPLSFFEDKFQCITDDLAQDTYKRCKKEYKKSINDSLQNSVTKIEKLEFQTKEDI